MKYISLILALAGIFSLILILQFQKTISISSSEQLNNLLENTKVQVEGSVTSIRQFGSSQILTLNNKIELICNCPEYQNKKISAIGKLDEYNNKKRIQVSDIREIN